MYSVSFKSVILTDQKYDVCMYVCMYVVAYDYRHNCPLAGCFGCKLRKLNKLVHGINANLWRLHLTFFSEFRHRAAQWAEEVLI
jgi:hypothetical protein